MATHQYATTLTWTGSTATGYDRTHEVTPDGAPAMRMSSDPAFGGEGTLANPEQLLLAAASSCQLLSFLAVAARARLDIVAYTDDASAVMPEDDKPIRLTEIVLRPRVVVRGDGAQRVEKLLDVAHKECFIANSLATPIRIEHTVEVVD